MSDPSSPIGEDDPIPSPVAVLLADGSTAMVRPAVPADRDALVAFHLGLSPESVTKRFFGPHPNLSDADLDRITSSGPDDVALLAERDARIVAVAEYHRALGSDEAEVAFVVDDAEQGHGIGTLLLEHLASQARDHGVRRLAADTLASNRSMLDVFQEAGFASTTRLDHDLVHVVLDVSPTPEAVALADARDQNAIIASMHHLLEPKSIAVIGASRHPGTIGRELLVNLVSGGFQGPVYPVNPAAAFVGSIPSWSNVVDVPGEVDLAVIAVPAAAVDAVVADCGAKRVAALVVVSSGFAEVGSDGASAQRRLTRHAHTLGMRLVGPNCFGVLNTDPSVQMNATFAPDVPIPGGVGFGSQSGGLGIAILADARSRGLGLSSFVSMGNKADVSANDLLTWWEKDPATQVILLYLESFGNPRKFARLARRIGRSKPIVVVKGGRSAVGAAAASSHTAALASSDQAVDAMFRESGIIRVTSVEELFDVAEVLVHQPLPEGDRIGILTNSGGPGVLAADACARWGLEVPVLSPSLQSTLAEGSAKFGSMRNPVDLAASATPEAYRRSLELLLRSGEVDAVVVIFTPPLVTTGDDVADAVVAAAASQAGSGRPVVATFFGTSAGRETLAAAERRIPCFTYPENAVRALAHAVNHESWRSRPVPTVAPVTSVDPNEARRRLSDHDPDGWVTGAAAMRLLDAYGIPTVPSLEVHDAGEAAEAAERLGFPAVLKALGSGIVHKSELGGVRLGLASPTDVQAAYLQMARHIGPAMSGAVLQPTVDPGVEIIMGFLQDRQFGPVVMTGLGGVAVELLGDHRFALAPIGPVEAREMLLSLRGAPLLTGFRGSSPVDLDALIDLLVRLSHLAADLPEILEADCNPVIAGPRGAQVVDARLRVDPQPIRRPDDRRRLK